jgi:hypothetical protein
MDITAAGTSAPMAIAANATPRKTTLDEVGGGDVAVVRGHRPEARHHEEDERKDKDRVRQREEAAGSDGPHESRTAMKV